MREQAGAGTAPPRVPGPFESPSRPTSLTSETELGSASTSFLWEAGEAAVRCNGEEKGNSSFVFLRGIFWAMCQRKDYSPEAGVGWGAGHCSCSEKSSQNLSHYKKKKCVSDAVQVTDGVATVQGSRGESVPTAGPPQRPPSLNAPSALPPLHWAPHGPPSPLGPLIAPQHPLPFSKGPTLDPRRAHLPLPPTPGTQATSLRRCTCSESPEEAGCSQPTQRGF